MSATETDLNKVNELVNQSEKKQEKELEVTAELIPIQTEGRGDCAFHASLGAWNPIFKRFICPNVAVLRKQIADEIRTGTKSRANRAIMEAMQQMIIAERHGDKAFRLAREQLQKFLSQHERQIREAWEEFEKELVTRPDIITFINEHAPSGRDLKNKVFLCLQNDENELYGMILSLEDLYKRYKTYTEKTIQGFDWETLLENKELREEYAVLMEKAASEKTDGYWLLPGELEIIAIVLNMTIELHITDGKTRKRRISEIYNPEAQSAQKVSIYFNGRNHYERIAPASPDIKIKRRFDGELPHSTSIRGRAKKPSQSRNRRGFSAHQLGHEPSFSLPMDSFQGNHDSYILLKSIDRLTAETISKRTGFQMEFHAGERASLRAVGAGGFGELRIGFSKKEQHYVGIKIPNQYGSLDNVKKELVLYQRIEGKRFRHILPMLDFYQDWQGDSVRLYQVMPLAGLGSVDKFERHLHALKNKQFKEQILFVLAESLLEGLSQLHSAGFYHLDIKPDNIVVQGSGEVFLIDFGCSAHSETGVISAEVSEGDLEYFSKERWLSFCGVDYDGTKADSWAAGLTLLRLWNSQYSHEPIKDCRDKLWDVFDLDYLPKGQFLKDEKNKKEIQECFKEVLNHLSSYIPVKDLDGTSIEALIALLLHSDVSQRLTPQAALTHPWMQRMRATASEWRENVRAHLREFLQSEQREQRTLGPQDLPLRHFTDFVERGATQASIVQRLLTETCEKSVITLCQGMGGVGKTQLVSYILHLEVIQNHFGVKLCFRNADNPSLLDVQVMALTRELGLVADKVSPKEALERLHAYLALESKQRGKPGIIIFDNAEEQGVLEPYFPPQGVHCVVTTRNPDWKEVTVVEVDVMTEPEAQMLTDRLLQKRNPEALVLCRALGFIPLGIAQACAYIMAESLSIPIYCELLQKESSALALLERDERPYGKKLPTSMFKMWGITIETLTKRSPAVVSLLNKLAYLASDALPQFLMNALGNLEDQRLLQKYSLLQVNGQGLGFIHRLLQVALRVQNDNKANEILIQVMKSLFELYNLESNTSEVIKANVQLLTHGEAVCAFAEKRENLDQEGSECIARTLSWLGDLQKVQSVYYQARNSFQRALAMYETIYGKDKAHSNIATSLINLGAAFHALGDLKHAIEYHQRTLVMYKAIYGKDKPHPGISMSLNNLGSAFLALGDFQQAIECCQRALAMYETIYGKDKPHLGISMSLNNLGSAFLALGNFQQAIECCQRALAMYETIYGKNKPHSDIAGSLNNLGSTFLALGDFQQAIEYCQRALTMYETIYGKDKPHFDIATNLNNLGAAFQNLGDIQQAINYHQRALAMREIIYGKDKPHLGISMSLNNLGVVFLLLGNMKQAIEYLQSALAIKETIHGKDKPHPDIASNLNNLGAAFQALGDFQHAIEYCQRALTMYETIYGKNKPHSNIAASLINVGSAFLLLGDMKRAMEYLQSALAINEKIYGIESSQVVKVRQLLGSQECPNFSIAM